MAKTPRLPPDENDGIDFENPKMQQLLEEARERAIRKKMDLIAQREIGLVTDDAGPEPKVKKGPPKLKKDHRITLDLAEHSDRLIIDSVIYLHGGTYTVDKPTYDTMREMVHRGWEHQREIDGKNNNAYRKQANVMLSLGDIAAA
jgi:hypothetical protein